MPTRGRTTWAAQAVQCFLNQIYPAKELIILDDAHEPSFKAPPVDCFYTTSESRDIGAKRNHCCRMAKGEIILHFDSDDWVSPDRIADQVQRLEESGKQVTGYHSLLFYGEQLAEDMRYQKYIGSVNYAVGVSLAYTKQWWLKHPFPEKKPKNAGEDNDMVFAARNAKELITADGDKFIVARIHEGNTAPKQIQGRQYRRMTRADFPEAFFQ